MNPEVTLRPARDEDFDRIVAMEHAPEHLPFVSQWPIERHRATAAQPDARYLMVECDGALAGYAILRGAGSPDRSIELLRFVIQHKGLGIGRAALRRVKRLAFDQLQAHRLWLDVLNSNVRARRLYESEGFVAERVVRAGTLKDGRYAWLVVMSVRETEV